MPTTLNLKNIPDAVYDQLKQAAEAHRRSMNREAIVCLEAVLLPTRATPAERLTRARELRAELPKGKLAGYTRRGTLAFDQACRLLIEAENLLSGAEFEVDSRAVLELVRDSDYSAYDCEFVALAIKLDTKLVTADKKLLRAFPARAMALVAG